MRVSNKAKAPKTPERMTNTNVTIISSLHEGMKQLADARRARDGWPTKLCRIYGEAVEQYLNAKPQRRLLKEYATNGEKTGRASGD
jgi:hypothetical protein